VLEHQNLTQSSSERLMSAYSGHINERHVIGWVAEFIEYHVFRLCLDLNDTVHDPSKNVFSVCAVGPLKRRVLIGLGYSAMMPDTVGPGGRCGIFVIRTLCCGYRSHRITSLRTPFDPSHDQQPAYSIGPFSSLLHSVSLWCWVQTHSRLFAPFDLRCQSTTRL